MSDAYDPYAGHLADFRFPRLQVACASCGRHGDYSVQTLRKLYGNPPMAEVPRFVAMRGNCPLALRYPGRDCEAHLVRADRPAVIEYLGTAFHAGMKAVLTCRRTRQGLKSVKPCPKPYVIDLGSLVAGLGHMFPIDQLERKLHCPTCGSRHYELAWIIPEKPSAAEPVPLRRAG